MKIYNKLIRDKIPEIMEKDGKKFEVVVLQDENDFLINLERKLIEELLELNEAISRKKIKDIKSELADVLLVCKFLKKNLPIIEQTRKHFNISRQSLEKTYIIKNKERGLFNKRLFLVQVF
jgi:predicted house-cleaning noncanonical NTP pyrophosphatase (MazG superfamily)